MQGFGSRTEKRKILAQKNKWIERTNAQINVEEK
jgi:hypothetical protein